MKRGNTWERGKKKKGRIEREWNNEKKGNTWNSKRRKRKWTTISKWIGKDETKLYLKEGKEKEETFEVNKSKMKEKSR